MSVAPLYAEAAKRAIGTALAHIEERGAQIVAIANVHDCISAFAGDLHGASFEQCIEAQARSLALLIHRASASKAEAYDRAARARRTLAATLSVLLEHHPDLGGKPK